MSFPGLFLCDSIHPLLEAPRRACHPSPQNAGPSLLACESSLGPLRTASDCLGYPPATRGVPSVEARLSCALSSRQERSPPLSFTTVLLAIANRPACLLSFSSPFQTAWSARGSHPDTLCQPLKIKKISAASIHFRAPIVGLKGCMSLRFAFPERSRSRWLTLLFFEPWRLLRSNQPPQHQNQKE